LSYLGYNTVDQALAEWSEERVPLRRFGSEEPVEVAVEEEVFQSVLSRASFGIILP